MCTINIRNNWRWYLVKNIKGVTWLHCWMFLKHYVTVHNWRHGLKVWRAVWQKYESLGGGGLKLSSRVNFINILHGHFLYKSLLSSFSLLRVWLWTNFRTKNVYVKCWWNWPQNCVTSIYGRTLLKNMFKIFFQIFNFKRKGNPSGSQQVRYDFWCWSSGILQLGNWKTSQRSWSK